MFRSSLILVPLVVLAACGRPEFGTPTKAGEEVVDTDVPRDDPDSLGGGDGVGNNDDGVVDEGPQAPPSDGEANNGVGGSPSYGGGGGFEPSADFAFSVYHSLAAHGRNAVFAPHGIARSLVVAYAAAGPDDAAVIAGVLTPYLGHDVYSGFNGTDLALEGRQSTSSFQLVGGVWADEDIEVSDQFVDTLARYLGLRINLVDFGAPEEARIAINNWHSSETDGRLTEVLGPRTIDATTRFVITDASFFSASWGFGGFDPANTMYETFHGTESNVEVPMMRTSQTFLAVDGPDFDAVILPYSGAFSLLAIVPDDITAFEEGLDPDFFNRLVGEARAMDIALRFPRVEVSDRVALSSVADALGLAHLFEPGIEYPALVDGSTIDDAYQRTRIVFHETGTDAVSDGSTDDGDAGAPDPSASPFFPMSFDRPFLFAIRDAQTGQLLFVGRLTQP